MQWRLLAGQSQLAMSKQSCWVLQAVKLKTNTYRHACSSYYWIEKPTTIKLNHLWRHNWNLRILVTDPCWLAWYRCSPSTQWSSDVLSQVVCWHSVAEFVQVSAQTYPVKSQHKTMITIHENLYYIIYSSKIENCFL